MPKRGLLVEKMNLYVSVLVGGVALGMYGSIFLRVKFGRDHLFGLSNMLDPRFEASLHSWLGSALLIGCAGLLAYVASSELAAPHFRRHWGMLAAGFVFLSADETAGIHELLIRVSRAAFGADSAPHLWAVFGLAAVLLIRLAYLPFLRHLSPELRKRTMAAAAIYLGGAIGVELLGGVYATLYSPSGPVYLTLAAIEETMELVGAAFYFLTLYRFAHGLPPAAAIPVSKAHVSMPERAARPTLRKTAIGGS